MFDLRAAVGDDDQPSRFCHRLAFRITYANLQPDRPRTDLDGFFDMRSHPVRTPENIYQVDWSRHAVQVRVAWLLQHLRRRSNRRDGVPDLLQVRADVVGGPPL